MLPSASYLVPISASLYPVASDGRYGSDEISCCKVNVSTSGVWTSLWLSAVTSWMAGDMMS